MTFFILNAFHLHSLQFEAWMRWQLEFFLKTENRFSLNAIKHVVGRRGGVNDIILPESWLSLSHIFVDYEDSSERVGHLHGKLKLFSQIPFFVGIKQFVWSSNQIFRHFGWESVHRSQQQRRSKSVLCLSSDVSMVCSKRNAQLPKNTQHWVYLPTTLFLFLNQPLILIHLHWNRVISALEREQQLEKLFWRFFVFSQCCSCSSGLSVNEKTIKLSRWLF